MEDKIVLKDDELEKVTGGHAESEQFTIVFCKQCGTLRPVSGEYDAQRKAFKYTCTADPSHVWYDDEI